MTIELDIEDGERAMRLILAEAARIVGVLQPAMAFGGSVAERCRGRLDHYARIINYGALAMRNLPEEPEERVMALAAHMQTIDALNSGRHVDGDA